RASSSILRTASGVEMSGSVVPLRTITAMPTLATTIRPSGRNATDFSVAAIKGTGSNIRSAFSPAVSFCWITLTCAKVGYTRWPVARSKSGITARKATCGPPPLRTRISSALATVAATERTSADRSETIRQRPLILNPVWVEDIPQSFEIEEILSIAFYQTIPRAGNRTGWPENTGWEMSAIGTKRTFQSPSAASAFGVKRTLVSYPAMSAFGTKRTWAGRDNTPHHLGHPSAVHHFADAANSKVRGAPSST